MTDKTLHNSTVSGARKNVKDIVVFGNGDTFKLICKASSKAEGWMKSTKAMEIPNIGCIVQVTTQQGDNIAEALTFVPGAKIVAIGGDPKNGRKLVCYINWSPKAQFDNGYTKVEERNKVEFSAIQEMVASLRYEFERVGKTTVTGCWAFLPSGFHVGYGESACVDPANFDFELGKKYALERCRVNATNELWKLEGYLLAVTLAKISI